MSLFIIPTYVLTSKPCVLLDYYFPLIIGFGDNLLKPVWKKKLFRVASFLWIIREKVLQLNIFELFHIFLLLISLAEVVCCLTFYAILTINLELIPTSRAKFLCRVFDEMLGSFKSLYDNENGFSLFLASFLKYFTISTFNDVPQHNPLRVKTFSFMFLKNYFFSVINCFDETNNFHANKL